MAVDNAVDLVGARAGLIDTHRECRDGPFCVGKPAVEREQIVQLELAGLGDGFNVFALGAGGLQCGVGAVGMQRDEVAVHHAAPRKERQQAVEQPNICAGLDGQVQVRQFARGGVARVDHHYLHLRPRFFCAHDALEQDRVAPGGVGAH